MNLVSKGAAAGVYPLTITGTTGAASATASVTLALGVVAPPVITPGTGTYLQPVAMSITDATNASTIYFTTDDSAPVVTPSERYTGPVTLSADTIVKAIATASARPVAAHDA